MIKCNCNNAKRLDNIKVTVEYSKLNNWKMSNYQYLEKEYSFGTKKKDSFLKAKAFVDKISLLAEKYSHHPDITFGWGYTKIKLLTHSVNGLTIIDFDMAKEIDTLV